MLPGPSATQCLTLGSRFRGDDGCVGGVPKPIPLDNTAATHDNARLADNGIEGRMNGVGR